MSVLTYNGVILPYPSVTNFEEENVTDDLSHTDRILKKYDITVLCIITADYLLALTGNPGNVQTDPADIMNSLEQKLNTPRRPLSFTFNGTDIIPIRQQGEAGFCDAKNGPEVISCRFTMMSNTTFLLNFRVVTHRWYNPVINATKPLTFSNRDAANVIYNRWTETIDLDNRQFSTRTREGKFMIRSDNLSGITPDEVRGTMCTLSVPAGWLRLSSRYTVTPDGLGLQYTIVDREQFKMPPAGAYEASGDYFESAQIGPTPVRMISCNVRLRGCNTRGRVVIRIPGVGAFSANQLYLLKRCCDICTAKVCVATGALVQRAGRGILNLTQNSQIRVSMWDNEVEAKMTAMANAANRVNNRRVLNTVGMLNRTLPTFVPLVDGNNPPAPPTFDLHGSGGYIMGAAAYYDPSLRGVTMNGRQMSAGLIPGQAGLNAE